METGLAEEEPIDAVFDGIRQAAGSMGNRQRAETLRIHLAQAAWLKA